MSSATSQNDGDKKKLSVRSLQDSFDKISLE